MIARNKRRNASDRAVYDIYRDERHFQATVEIDTAAPLMLRVLLGALQPAGKVAAWDAIRATESAASFSFEAHEQAHGRVAS